MAAPVYSYDELSDTLYISFMPGELATGVELNDHILLRLDKRSWKAVGITVFDYSILAQPSELGQRSFPLTGLTDLPSDVRQRVLDVLLVPPVNDVLALSAYTPSFADTMPIASLRLASLAAA